MGSKEETLELIQRWLSLEQPDPELEMTINVNLRRLGMSLGSKPAPDVKFIRHFGESLSNGIFLKDSSLKNTIEVSFFQVKLSPYYFRVRMDYQSISLKDLEEHHLIEEMADDRQPYYYNYLFYIYKLSSSPDRKTAVASITIECDSTKEDEACLVTLTRFFTLNGDRRMTGTDHNYEGITLKYLIPRIDDLVDKLFLEKSIKDTLLFSKST